MTIQALRERRNAIGAQMKDLLDKEKNPQWTAELSAKYAAMEKDIDAIDSNIRAMEAHTQRFAEEAELDQLQDRLGGKDNPSAQLLNKWLRGGDNALSAEDWTVVRAAMSTTTPDQGGYTVPTELATSLIEVMASFGGMRDVATLIKTATGIGMSWATTDGTSEEGEIIGENQPASDDDVEFGTVGLGVYKFSSKVVTVPIELLQDSAVDLEGLIRRRLAERLARIQNRLFTVGTGTNQPRGVLTAATVGKVGATGQTSLITLDDLIDLEHEVDPAYRTAARFMFHDKTLKVLKKLKDGQGRPIWLPGYDSRSSDSLLGYEYTINQHMPQMAANAKPVLFGDFSRYIIRDALELSLFRFTDSAYTKKGQVGYLAWGRAGGNFVDTGPSMKCYQNSAT
jgi:HK97 family phage major capsid protein